LEDTGHDGTLREMAREEVIVDSDAFVTDSVFALFDFEDTVDQKERVPVSLRKIKV
jgi:hypothetical protein